MKRFNWMILVATAALSASCNGKDEDGGDDTAPTGETDADTDTDTDTDSDTDADADADADADTDADTDTDTGDTGGTSGGDFTFADDGPGAYTRVDRMGMPAVATAVITSKDAYNAADPSDDVAGDFVGEIVGSLDFLHGALDDDLGSLGLAPCTVAGGTGTCVTQAGPLVIPDTIKINSLDPAGFPNGRLLSDPVIDVTLAVVLLDLSVHSVTLFAGLPLNPPENDVAFKTTFPYLADPN